MNNRIYKIQQRLSALGYNPGPIDGIRGRLTIGAIKEFQSEAGLEVDGIIGPQTWSALFEAGAGTAPAASDDHDLMPWFDEAERLMGTKEGAGSKDNKTILDWANDLDIHFPQDSIPWCGLFVAHCIGSTLPDEPLPQNPLGARNWAHFGERVPPQLGSILVFWRGKREGWSGHVGFYKGEDFSSFYVLGGNQSDSVSVARIAKTRLLDSRWPLTALPASGESVTMSLNTELSTNEA